MYFLIFFHGSGLFFYYPDLVGKYEECVRHVCNALAYRPYPKRTREVGMGKIRAVFFFFKFKYYLVPSGMQH